jgi:hypothetical protein
MWRMLCQRRWRKKWENPMEIRSLPDRSVSCNFAQQPTCWTSYLLAKWLNHHFIKLITSLFVQNQVSSFFGVQYLCVLFLAKIYV